MTGLLAVRRRRLAALGRAGRNLPVLMGSRLAEQAVLGGVAVLLAWRLGPQAFAPVSALLVVNSAAVTLSDYGLGLAALRATPAVGVARRSLRSVRAANALVAGVGVAVGLVLGGTVGTAVAASGVIWAVAAEAYVRKAGAIGLGQAHEAARAEIVGALALAVPILVFAHGSAALAVVGAALVAKHTAESLLLPHALDAFTPSGARPGAGALFTTQALAYGIANVDYLLVGLVLGAEWFAVYSLGYRVAVVVPSIVAYTANRTALADLGAVPAGRERQRTHRHYVRLLFWLGAGAAVGLVLIGAALALVLGARWDAVAPTVALLAVATPWRMVMGQSGSLALAVDGARRLAAWEVVRLVATVAVLGIAALAGYWSFVAAAGAVTIAAAAVLHDRAARHAGLVPWAPLLRWSAVAVSLLGAGAIAAWWW